MNQDKVNDMAKRLVAINAELIDIVDELQKPNKHQQMLDYCCMFAGRLTPDEKEILYSILRNVTYFHYLIGTLEKQIGGKL